MEKHIMPTIKPIIAIQRILDTVWTLAFHPTSDCEAQIIALTRTHHEIGDEIAHLPVFHLVEGEGRTVTTIHCKSCENSTLETTSYEVTNPQFIFSYSDKIVDETFINDEKSAKDESLEMLCVIEASGTFLTEHLTPEQYKGDEDELNEFIQEHLWQPVEDYEPSDVIEMIANLGCSMESFIKKSILEKQPNYAVIWHYEGESPTLFTCRSESKDEAEFLFNANMIDHESNHVMEFHIDSIEPLKL
jgi:hypothetical protein